MSSAQEELAALEMLRDASSDIVKHLESMNNKLDDLNKQNELSLRVLENWCSVMAISKATSQKPPNAMVRNAVTNQ